jgi:hypothetical protein
MQYSKSWRKCDHWVCAKKKNYSQGSLSIPNQGLKPPKENKARETCLCLLYIRDGSGFLTSSKPCIFFSWLLRSHKRDLNFSEEEFRVGMGRLIISKTSGVLLSYLNLSFKIQTWKFPTPMKRTNRSLPPLGRLLPDAGLLSTNWTNILTSDQIVNIYTASE